MRTAAAALAAIVLSAFPSLIEEAAERAPALLAARVEADHDVAAEGQRQLREPGAEVLGVGERGGFYERLRELNLPTVLVNAPIDGLGFATVSCDDTTSMEQAFGHLLQLGHRRIGPRLEVYAINSGAEAIENAFKMAFKMRPGRTHVAAVEQSFHGRTAACASTTWGAPQKWYFLPRAPFDVTAHDVADELLWAIQTAENGGVYGGTLG